MAAPPNNAQFEDFVAAESNQAMRRSNRVHDHDEDQYDNKRSSGVMTSNPLAKGWKKVYNAVQNCRSDVVKRQKPQNYSKREQRMRELSEQRNSEQHTG